MRRSPKYNVSGRPPARQWLDAACSLFTFVLAATGASAQSLRGLGDAPGGQAASCALAISADGRVITGWTSTEAGTRAFKWQDGEMVILAASQQGAIPLVGHAISADGQVIVGLAQSVQSSIAFRWEAHRTTSLPPPPNIPGATDAWGVSADGAIVSGYSQSRERDRALGWKGGQSFSLPDLSNETTSSSAAAISADGETIVGQCQEARGTQAVYWHDGAVTPLGDLEGGESRSDARAVSPDGAMIVGSAASSFGIEGFKWRSNTMTALGSLSREHEFLSVARSLSADGTIVVGHAIDDRETSQAVVWEDQSGIRTLSAVLTEFGVDLGGWRLEVATGVSADGCVIVGCGRNPAGEPEAWIASLPSSWWRERFAPHRPPDVLPNGARAPSVLPRLGRASGLIEAMREPYGAAVAADRTIYIADSARNHIRVLGPDRTSKARWGSRGSGIRLRRPRDVAVADDGVVFVADTGSHRVQCIDLEGRLRRMWGGHGAGPQELSNPEGIAVDANSVYVADTGNDRIQVFDRRGTHLRTIGRFGHRDGELSDPTDVAVGTGGRVFVADTGNDRVCAFGAQGDSFKCWGQRGSSLGLFNRPTGVECRDGRVYVVDYGNHRVQVFDEEGDFQYAWGRQVIRPREAGGRIFYPGRLAIAPDHASAIICEPHEDRCQLFGMLDSSSAPESQFNRLLDTAPLTHMGGALHISEDLMVVTDVTTDCVFVYRLTENDPVLITKVGNPGHLAGQLCDAEGLWINGPAGELLIADSGNHRLQMFDLGNAAGESTAFTPNLGRFIRTIDLTPRPSEQRQFPPAFRPRAIARSRDGTLAIGDAQAGGVLLLGTELQNRRWLGGVPGSERELIEPIDLAFSHDSRHLLVLDGGRSRVVVFDSAGAYIGSWSVSDAEDDDATVWGGIEAGQDGFVYVSDAARHRVKKFDETGRFLLQWGKSGVGADEFFKPQGIAQDAQGRIYVNDFGNRRIQVFTADGRFLRTIGPPLTVHPTLSRDSE
jgi:probable HAF family extracellular repeat protein